MQQSAPGLLPLFRSQTELAVLGVLFTGPLKSWGVGELATHLGLNPSTVSREIAHLENAGVVTASTLGRNKLVMANWEVPWAGQLAQLLDRTIGPAGLIADALASLPGMETAVIFGSWAERYAGRVGPAPRDIDVLVVGDVDIVEVQLRLDRVAQRVGVDVNPVTVTSEAWASPEPGSLIDNVVHNPIVTIVEPSVA